MLRVEPSVLEDVRLRNLPKSSVLKPFCSLCYLGVGSQLLSCCIYKRFSICNSQDSFVIESLLVSSAVKSETSFEHAWCMIICYL